VESRLHDSAYAHNTDQGHITAADKIYYDRSRSLGVTGVIAGDLVLYGNHILRSAANLFDNSYLDVPGLTNLVGLYDWVQHKDQYISDVLNYYQTDPFLSTHQVYPPNGVTLSSHYNLFGLTHVRPDVSIPVYHDQLDDFRSLTPIKGIEVGDDVNRTTLMTVYNPTRSVRWAPRRRRQRQFVTKLNVKSKSIKTT